MFFRSERLFLRPGWPEDRSEILAALADDAPLCAALAEPWYVEHCRAGHGHLAAQRCPQFVVTLPGAEGSRVIGAIGLISPETEAELVCAIAPAFRGRGYATEAARALVTLAGTLGHRRLLASHGPDDFAANRMLRKVGFRPTGATCVHPGGAGNPDRAKLVHALELDRPTDCDGDDDRVPRAA